MSPSTSSVRNERLHLTAQERAAIDHLDERSFARPPDGGADPLARMRREVAKETREALAAAVPDIDERARSQAERYGSTVEELKGTAWPARVLPGPPMVLAPVLGGIGGLLHPIPTVVIQDPPHAGELWWAETSSFATAPGNALTVDIDHDPYRIWGHIRYNNDNLFNGTVGIAMTFMLTPDRMPRLGGPNWEVRPDLHPLGWVSGWTDQYHPIWHADDKWSKCWHNLSASLTLSSGEWLAGDNLIQNVFFLANVNPVGQASTNEFFSWLPVLRFTADMRVLRQRNVSIILRTELRYDFQLEGGSDIWFRHRPGSSAESVPGFDNALGYRCWPGVVTRV